jgi:hypothetical protein
MLLKTLYLHKPIHFHGTTASRWDNDSNITIELDDYFATLCYDLGARIEKCIVPVHNIHFCIPDLPIKLPIKTLKEKRNVK